MSSLWTAHAAGVVQEPLVVLLFPLPAKTVTGGSCTEMVEVGRVDRRVWPLVTAGAHSYVRRMEPFRAAQQLAEQYAATGAVSAVVLAGSLGRGRADAFSDVELDVYWASPPSDDQRQVPTLALDGEITRLWPYDSDDSEWSEDVHVLGFDVTVSGFVAAEIDRWVASLAASSEPYLVRQMRMSALLQGEVLHGGPTVAGWRSAGEYPRGLAVATAADFLSPGRLSRWRLWPALVQRDDLVMLHRVCADVIEVVLGTLCALNRIYIEHPSFKWSRHLTSRFTRAPVDFDTRLFAALTGSPATGAPDLHALLTETVQLVASDLPEVDVSAIDGILNCRR